MTPNPNRIDPLTPANTETDARLAPIPQPPAVGAVIGQTALKVLTAVVALAALVVAAPAGTVPASWTPIAGAIVAIGTVFGLASPGIRRQP